MFPQHKRWIEELTEDFFKECWCFFDAEIDLSGRLAGDLAVEAARVVRDILIAEYQIEEDDTETVEHSTTTVGGRQ